MCIFFLISFSMTCLDLFCLVMQGLVGNCGSAAPPGGVTRPLLFIPNRHLYNNEIIKSQKTHNTKASITTFKLSELRKNYHKTVA